MPTVPSRRSRRCRQPERGASRRGPGRPTPSGRSPGATQGEAGPRSPLPPMGSCGHGRTALPPSLMSPVPGSGRMEQLAQAVAERVVTIVMDAIDIDAILERVDVDGVVSRVDVDGLIDRVDVEKIIDRVDVQKIIERVDVKDVVDRVDIDALLEQTELGSIIARSTTGVASEVLDVVRAQGVGLDDFFARWVNRILRRSKETLPQGPPTLVGPEATARLATPEPVSYT